MRRTLIGVALVLATAAPAAAALPHAASFVPGRSLAGIRLGEPAAQVRAALGDRYGICKGCAATTWYYTYRPFTREGLGVELENGRVSAVYTVWRPDGWHAAKGLRLGAVAPQVNALAGPLVSLICPNYTVLVRDTATIRTVFYIVDDKLWGFGLVRPADTPCR